MSKRSKLVLMALILATAPALTAVTPAVAEDPPAQQADKEDRASAEELASWMVGELVEPLALTESQAEQIRPLFVAEVERIEAIFAEYRGGQNDGGGMGNVDQQIADSKARTMAALEPILSAEQLEKLKVIQQERSEEVSGQLIVQRLQGLLDLTPEQRDQLVPIFAEDVRQRRALMREAAQSGGDQKVMRALQGELNELQQHLDARLDPILTEEQMSSFREYESAMRQEMRQRMKGTGKSR